MRRYWLFFLALTIAFQANGATPKKSTIFSCLLARATDASVIYSNLPTDEVNTEDVYKPGYNAKFLITIEGKDIGYAESDQRQGIIYDRIVYPTNTAKMLLGIKERPGEFDPFSAEWGTVKDQREKFLFVSFPFGDLGKSGSFQKVRAAYLLELTPAKKSRSLFFVVANTAIHEKK